MKLFLRITRYFIIAEVLFLTCSAAAYAQKNTYYASHASSQLGAAIKLSVEVGSKKNNLINWRLGLSAGTGAFLGNDWLYPSLNVDLMLYHSGIGSSLPGDSSAPKIDVELNIAYTVTAGLDNRLESTSKIQPGVRDYPLYYFNTFNRPSLQNPFNWSASWGGNAIFLLTRPKDKFQQVGFLNLHLYRVQLSYSNDGPPFFPPFADKRDRFHTGGGFISLHGDQDWAVNLLEVGFNKFTGYSKNTYELSNQAGVIYLYYHDELQQFYNKSQFFVNVANTAKHWEASVNFYNYDWLDIQHTIHQHLYYPLHMVAYTPYVALRGSYTYSTTKIGIQ